MTIAAAGIGRFALSIGRVGNSNQAIAAVFAIKRLLWRLLLERIWFVDEQDLTRVTLFVQSDVKVRAVATGAIHGFVCGVCNQVFEFWRFCRAVAIRGLVCT